MPVRVRIASLRNECVKRVGWQLIKSAAPFVRMSIRRRIENYARDQARLRILYGIQPKTPISSWSPRVEDRLHEKCRDKAKVQFVLTSGSTSKPKNIPYTPKRLREIKRASFEAIVQAAVAFDLDCPTIFVLSTMKKDESLSSLLLQEKSSVSFLDGLMMPSRYLWHPALEPLIDEHGPTAARFCLLVLSNPRILYATNPSTLALFLESLERTWADSTGLLRKIIYSPNQIDPGARKILRKVLTPGWERRVRTALSASRFQDLRDTVPALRCYCCWDGGYVVPFLEIVGNYLSKEYYIHLPMYSMSTECIQTQVYFIDKEPHYLPVARGLLYEFLPDGAKDDPNFLIPACDLQIGQCYSMVVSDCYGLSRYQTNDIFLCTAKIGGTPDLRFRRRGGLTYSFTGEKLTGHQVEAACNELMKMHPRLRDFGIQMTLVPARSDQRGHGAIAHYRLVMAHTSHSPPAISSAEISRAFDGFLSMQNHEFAAKRDSGRLGPTQAIFLNYDHLAQLLKSSEASHNRDWDSQFKLSPLLPRQWDEVGLPPLEDVE